MNGRLFAVCSVLLVTACLLASLPPLAYAKTQLMPDFDFDAYNHDEVEAEHEAEEVTAAEETTPAVSSSANTNATASTDEVDKW